MKRYIVYYHRKGQGKRKFNNMTARVDAWNVDEAREIFKQNDERGLWTIEAIRRA